MTDVLLVSPTGAPGGAERALAGLARRLPAFGYRPKAVLLQPGPFEKWLADVGCPVEVIPMGRTREIHRTLPVIERLRRRCRSVPVVVANQSKGQAIVAAAAALSRTPCVWWQHGIPSRSPIEFVAGSWPSKAIVCSPGPAADAQRMMTPRRRVEVISPGIDTDFLQTRAGEGKEIRKRLAWTGPVVGMVARLQPAKGQQLFLHAASILAQRRPDVQFVIVGGAVLGWEGDYSEELRCQAAKMGLSERLYFAGHQDDPHPWVDSFDVAVIASMGDSFGLVTVEALALGKPVVGVRSAGTAEIIADRVSGLLVPPADPRAMAAAILEVLSDETLRARISAGAAARAEQFTDMEMTRKFAGLLDDVRRPR